MAQYNYYESNSNAYVDDPTIMHSGYDIKISVNKIVSLVQSTVSVEYQNSISEYSLIDQSVSVQPDDDTTIGSAQINISKEYLYQGGGVLINYSTPSSAVFQAPEIEGLEFVGWYSLPNPGSIVTDESIGLSPSNYTNLITNNASTTWGVLSSGIASCLYLNENISGPGLIRTIIRSYYNYLRLIYRGKTILLTLNPNGGYFSDISNYYKFVTFGEKYGTIPAPTRSGYNFEGWYTAAVGGTLVDENTTVTISTNHTLYAHWSQNPVLYTLYFEPNGGTVSELSRQVYSGSSYGILPTPTWNNYSFTGWFTSPIGGTQVSENTIMSDDDTTIYAQWNRNMVSVIFLGNGGTPSSQTLEYPEGSVFGILPIAERYGFNFVGWFTESEGGTKVDVNDIASAQTLYAHWVAAQSVSSLIWKHLTNDFLILFSST